MSRQILAIDIRNETLTAILLNLGLKQNTVIDSAIVPISDPAESDKPLSEALARLIENIDSRAASIAVAIPNDNVLYHKLQVPFKEDSKIRRVLPFELEPFIPIDIDDLKIDFHKNKVGEQTDILAVAIDQVHLQKYMDALADNNIRIEWVVPGSFPLAKYIANHEEFAAEQFLLLDLNLGKATIFAIKNGRIELVRRLRAGADDEQSAEALALRMRQTLTAINDDSNADFTPSTVYVTGPGVYDDNAFRHLSRAMELPTIKLDMAQWATRLDMDNQVDWNMDMMNNALALALLEAEGSPCANFHRIHSPLRNIWTAYRPYVRGPVTLLAIALIIGMICVINDSYRLNKRVRKLDDQIKSVYLSTFPGSRINAPPLKLMRSKVKELSKGNTISGKKPEAQTIDVLLQISKSIPNKIDVVFTQFTMSGNSVSISGETKDFNSVDDIKNHIEDEKLFKRVTIASANTSKSTKKVRFKLKIEI